MTETEGLAQALLTGRFGADVAATDPAGRRDDGGLSGPLPAGPSPPAGGRIGASESRATWARGPRVPRRRRWPVQADDRYYREVARLGAQVADALAYAHQRGVLHRDIKPSNLLLDAVGNVWVTDFGLAKLEDDDLSHSRDIVGTMRYMSPERFRNVSDPSGDLYALGATLYEMVTLRPGVRGAATRSR